MFLTGLSDRVILQYDLDAPPSRPAGYRRGATWRPDGLSRRLIDSWLRLGVLWLHRRGLRLRGLVERPGAVAVTDTHIDICFRLELTDLAIRKAGLDLDPGWVPSFGRVIHYHYLSSGEGHA